MRMAGAAIFCAELRSVWFPLAFECKLLQLLSAADMFPESGLQSEFLNEFYVMDVILNRAPSPAASTCFGGDWWWWCQLRCGSSCLVV